MAPRGVVTTWNTRDMDANSNAAVDTHADLDPLTDVDLLTEILRAFVLHPTDMRVEEKLENNENTLTIHVHPDDISVVIGRDHSTINALRHIFSRVAVANNMRAYVNIEGETKPHDRNFGNRDNRPDNRSQNQNNRNFPNRNPNQRNQNNQGEYQSRQGYQNSGNQNQEYPNNRNSGPSNDYNYSKPRRAQFKGPRPPYGSQGSR